MRLSLIFGIPRTLELDFSAARCRSTSRLKIRARVSVGSRYWIYVTRESLDRYIGGGSAAGLRRKSGGDGPVEAKGSPWSTTWNRFLGGRR